MKKCLLFFLLVFASVSVAQTTQYGQLARQWSKEDNAMEVALSPVDADKVTIKQQRANNDKLFTSKLLTLIGKKPVPVEPYASLLAKAKAGKTLHWDEGCKLLVYLEMHP